MDKPVGINLVYTGSDSEGDIFRKGVISSTKKPEYKAFTLPELAALGAAIRQEALEEAAKMFDDHVYKMLTDKGMDYAKWARNELRALAERGKE